MSLLLWAGSLGSHPRAWTCAILTQAKEPQERGSAQSWLYLDFEEMELAKQRRGSSTFQKKQHMTRLRVQGPASLKLSIHIYYPQGKLKQLLGPTLGLRSIGRSGVGPEALIPNKQPDEANTACRTMLSSYLLEHSVQCAIH